MIPIRIVYRGPSAITPCADDRVKFAEFDEVGRIVRELESGESTSEPNTYLSVLTPKALGTALSDRAR